jgi:signal transduction histidine kinase
MASSRGSLLNFSRVADYAARVPADEKKLAELTAELTLKNEQLATALERVAESERAQMKLEQELRAANEQFDEKIQERTSELIRSNELLQREIQRRVQTEEMLRKLSARILTLQDEERRRLGRELHDSAGQMLAALHINLGVIAQRTRQDPGLASKVADSASLADQVITEIRTLSYLLHPPMLDEAGLASAVEWYVRGFSERSKIAVRMKIDPGLPRFPTDVETAIFRIVQESLVNIHRHSGSRTAFISLRASSAGATLIIRDEGRGLPPQVVKNLEEGSAGIGVGIGGMRERARQLGGSIEIRSASPGTLVEVNLPVLKYVPSNVVNNREAVG